MGSNKNDFFFIQYQPHFRKQFLLSIIGFIIKRCIE